MSSVKYHLQIFIFHPDWNFKILCWLWVGLVVRFYKYFYILVLYVYTVAETVELNKALVLFFRSLIKPSSIIFKLLHPWIVNLEG